MPFRFAASTARSPESVINPFSRSVSTFFLFLSDQGLLGRRWAKYLAYLVSSMLLICPSIHPKQRASSRASFADSVAIALVLPNTSHTPSVVSAFSRSHVRKSSREANSTLCKLFSVEVG